MPGSLLLSNNDAWSDESTRSLDSKLGGKRVSFNKAVRVKQYPWKPNTSTQMGDHLTLPSNRFWFKVYQNKDEPNNDTWEHNRTAWEQENMECVHDSLAPIAEDEDQDIDENYPTNKEHWQNSNGDNFGRNLGKTYDTHNSHPIEPPIDYIDNIPKATNRDLINSNKSNVSEKNQRGLHSINNLNLPNGISPERRQLINRNDYGILSSINEDNLLKNSGNKFSGRQVERRWNISNDLGKSRERRSRSHDDYRSNENNIDDNRKADKSVSTEDLNYSDNDSLNRDLFFRRSKDMSTQCYGTLSKGKGKITGLSMFKRFNAPDEGSNNLFKSSRSSFHGRGTKEISNSIKYQKNENHISKRDSENTTSKFNIQTTDSFSSSGRYSTSNLRKSEQRNKPLSSINKTSPIKKYNDSTYDYVNKSPLTKPKYNTKEYQSDALRGLESSRQLTNRSSNTVGYVRGRQIPLAEVNTNTNRKISTRYDDKSGYLSSPTRPRKDILSDTKSESSRTSGSKKYFFSKSDASKDKMPSFRLNSSSAKSSSGYNDSQSMIDWSLSGFQLAARNEGGTTSISDSECTVHRRAPLLMYIPGVSHHDRPAEEDDRLSILSDMSRSEVNDELTKGLDSRNEIKRRYSMPRDSKLKWIKWKNNAKR